MVGFLGYGLPARFLIGKTRADYMGTEKHLYLLANGRRAKK